MSGILLSRAPREARPIIFLTEAKLPAFLKKQPKAVSRWVAAQRFEAKAGSFCVMPKADGNVDFVLAGISDPVRLWDTAALPFGLPEGVYRIDETGGAEPAEKLALGWYLGAAKLKSYKKDKRKASSLAFAEEVDLTAVTRMGSTISYVRDLITTPAEELTPEVFAAEIEKTGLKHGAEVSQIIGDALLQEGFNAIHAVGRASVHAPRLVDLRWGDPAHPSVTLVGKGVCFDAGGLSLKPTSAMTTMKKDMAGAAVALGIASLIMANKVPVCLRLLVPVVENAIGDNAFRVSDVIKMKGGLSVEIVNTDAEGRLITADALAEAAKEKPDLLIDLVTFGPARGVFGPEMAALLTNDDKLAEGLLASAAATEDPIWRMPLNAAYESWLDSPIADMNNAPDKPYGGLMTSALFLQRFIGKKQSWAHLDFMAWNISSRPGRPLGGEAMTLRAVYRFLENRFPKG
jgi:leucyl aminopeptidase